VTLAADGDIGETKIECCVFASHWLNATRMSRRRESIVHIGAVEH
jgi:hypothetical protein